MVSREPSSALTVRRWACDSAVVERVIEWVLRVDGQFAGALLHNHAHQDWRAQVAHITLPTLVIVGRASVVPWTAGRWIAETIPGARLEIVEADEGGSHLFILENPAEFNRLLGEFVA